MHVVAVTLHERPSQLAALMRAVTASNLLSLLVSAIAIAVTVALAIRTGRAQRRASEALRRSRVTDLLVSAMERSIRRESRPAFARLWVDPSAEALLLAPRLLKQLGGRDKAVERWAFQQVSRQLQEPKRKKALELQVDLTMKLLEWERGERPAAWFEQAAAGSELVTFEVPRSVRHHRARALLVGVFGNSVGAALLVALTGRVWRLL